MQGLSGSIPSVLPHCRIAKLAALRSQDGQATVGPLPEAGNKLRRPRALDATGAERRRPGEML